jgi:hypothetical protein
MKYDIRTIATAIEYAVEAAQEFAAHDDGGTSNLDSAFIQAEGMSHAEAEEIGKISGVRVYLLDSEMYGRILMLGGITNGQGFRRTKMAEVAQQILAEKGLDSGVWYQMD